MLGFTHVPHFSRFSLQWVSTRRCGRHIHTWLGRELDGPDPPTANTNLLHRLIVELDIAPRLLGLGLWPTCSGSADSPQWVVDPCQLSGCYPRKSRVHFILSRANAKHSPIKITSLATRTTTLENV